MSSRNLGVQEEYARTLEELDNRISVLKRAILEERCAQKLRKRNEAKREREERNRGLLEKNGLLKESIQQVTVEVLNRQQDFLRLQVQLENESADENDELIELEGQEDISFVMQSLEADPDLTAEAAQLRQEVDFLRQARDSSCKQANVLSKTQYEERQKKLEEGVNQMKSLLEERQMAASQNSTRLLSLIRTLALSSSIGALMIRFYQQLKDETSSSKKKSIGVTDFIKTCPNAIEAKQAIEQLTNLGLIDGSESGILSLAM